MITQDELKNLFYYENGVLFWKNVHPCSPVKAGDKAGHLTKGGYLRTGVQRKLYLNHRLIFLMHYGHIPDQLDHINGVRTDNRIENLREATKYENTHNQRTRKDNTSGVKGVYWNKQKNKWYVRVGVFGKRKFLGGYDDLELASLVAEEARNLYHGEYARHA